MGYRHGQSAFAGGRWVGKRSYGVVLGIIVLVLYFLFRLSGVSHSALSTDE